MPPKDLSFQLLGSIKKKIAPPNRVEERDEENKTLFILYFSRQLIMPREAEPSLNERAFVVQALQEGLRVDGRAFDQYRQLELKFGEQYGVADVTLGKTR